jgi:glycosyltransferase involved in cell wall biosynthesis
MLVTVIIPAFNHARFIDECVGSVLAQDHPQLEVIVVDDGSSDGTLERLQAYGERITLLRQRGGRQARARNMALRVARGELVAFLDSDDRYLPGRIRLAVEAFHADPSADVIWGDYRRIDAGGALLGDARWTPRCADFRHELIAGNPICNATVTVRRAALDEIGGFDERVPRVCDGAAWYQIAARGRRFVHLNEMLLEYRVHDANDSRGFAAMTRDRDHALVFAAQAYLQFGVIADEPPQRRWLRDVLVRQFAFRAAAGVQRGLERSMSGRVRAWIYDALGSDTGLALLARLQLAKQALRPRAGASA